MIKMPPPDVTHDQTLKACCDGIVPRGLNSRISISLPSLTELGKQYKNSGESGALYSLSSYQDGDPLIPSDCSEAELKKLYEYYLVKKKPGRSIYDRLLVAAEERCPYCGGIGVPANLDHYLPKTSFAQYSVLPINLIPACRDCNMGFKGTGAPSRDIEQVLHPFLDAPHFFEEQWLHANYFLEHNGEPSYVEFHVRPPDHWSSVDKDRVENHFNEFGLAHRYSTRAAQPLCELEEEKAKFISNNLTLQDFYNITLKTIIDEAPFVNYWKRVMCIAIADSIRTYGQ